MAAQHLTILSTPNFPQVLYSAIDRALEREIGQIERQVSVAFAKVHLSQCDWSDEFCDCFQRATVHDLKSEQEFCLRHFAEVEARRG